MSAPLATMFAEANVELLALLVVVVAVVSSALVKPFRRRTVAGGTRVTRLRTATPTPFSYWYAQVPFEHDDGAKERPVLVLRVEGVNARVLNVTSRPKSGRTNWRRVDTSRWDRPGQREGSWLQTDKVTTVPLAGFRRCLGLEHNDYFRRELFRLHPTEFGQPHATPSGDPQP
jgi:mRNA-degrading endonuclease toxin of MazEF toxin-antitoxin module